MPNLPLCLKCALHHIEAEGCAASTYKPFKPYWDEHIAGEPVYIENLAQHERVMRANGLVARPREHRDDLNHRRWLKGLPPVRD